MGIWLRVRIAVISEVLLGTLAANREWRFLVAEFIEPEAELEPATEPDGIVIRFECKDSRLRADPSSRKIGAGDTAKASPFLSEGAFCWCPWRTSGS
jgi:hypothetical protein